MLQFLSLNLKKQPIIYINENKLNFTINDNFYKNTYYRWKTKSNLFNWKSIFYNNKTKSNKVYIRQYYEIYINTHNNKFIHHKHIIYCSSFHLKNMKNFIHFYIDGTFINPSEFSQIIIILYIHNITNRKILGVYILLNHF